jgi:hypothetical protein
MVQLPDVTREAVPRTSPRDGSSPAPIQRHLSNPSDR